jgi:hypothetical protein
MSEAPEITPHPFTKPGQVGSPQQAAFQQQSANANAQASLTTGGRRRRRNKYLKGGAGEVVVPPVSNAAGIPGVSNQVAGTTSTSVNSQAAAQNDSLVGESQPIVNSQGGRRRSRSKKIIRRVKKSRKTRKTRRVKKSRNTKKKQ